MTTTTPAISHKRRRRTERGENHYLTVDGQDVKVSLDTVIYVALDYKATTPGPVFSTDYAGTIYRYSDREWSDEAGTFFYPFATTEEAALFNAIIDVVVEHSDRFQN